MTETPEDREALRQADCTVCGLPKHRHSGGNPNSCPIIATYRPRSNDAPTILDADTKALEIARAISGHAAMANGAIRLNRDGGGNGRVKVATCMHHIERLSVDLIERLSARQPADAV